MSATEELRRLLDERGVEWDGESYESVTFWNDDESLAVASDDRDDLLWVSQRLTPAQAIDATLGQGTCHIVKTWSDSDYVDGWRYRCSECGCFIPVNERDYETGDVISAANYCPNCGRRVVDA